MKLIHDHLFICPTCTMPVKDLRDCICSEDPVTYMKCADCKEQEAYDEVEHIRNAED